MSQLTLKEIAMSVSKVRDMEKLGLKEQDNFNLAFHLVKIYRLWSELGESIKAIKSVLLSRKMDKMFFWEDEFKVLTGNKNATSEINVQAIFDVAAKEGLLPEFFAACTLVDSKVTNLILRAAIVVNKKTIPGEVDGELKIAKITKEEKLLNV